MDPNPAIPQDLANRGYAIASDPVVEQTRLDEVWRALSAEVPGLRARIDAGTLSNDLVVDIICSATLRVLRNPEGRESNELAIDDYREGWKLANSTEDIYFTAAELRRLTPVTYGAGSVQFT